jgi:subtilisin family serine protease
MKTLARVVWLILFAVTPTLIMASQAQASQPPSVSDRMTSRDSNAQSYIVVLRSGQSDVGYSAIREAGGAVVRSNKLDIATVTSFNPRFAEALEQSGAVLGVARNAGFYQAPAAPLAVSPPPNTQTQAAEATACAALYGVPSTIGPDPLSPCQWDMRAINASPTGSYAINQGQGVKVGVMDTGIDLTHGDLMPNVDLAASCVFLYSTTPTADPAEQVTRGDCSNKAALQDLAGHGTHTAGTIAAPINGTGIAGVAPKATIVALKSGTAEGYFFTDSVVDGLIYAGDHKLDVVSMSFFADPWLFNCRNDKEQKAIVQAISRAAKYAQQRGVVLVAA